MSNLTKEGKVIEERLGKFEQTIKKDFGVDIKTAYWYIKQDLGNPKNI